METQTLRAQNIKCDGCAKTIREGLAPLDGVETVEVDVQSGEVSLRGDNLDMAAVKDKLTELGYPLAN